MTTLHRPGRGCRPRMTQRRRHTTFSPPKGPAPIEGATWQAGVTANSERFKVLLNGEAFVGIIAAGLDWVLIAPELELTKVTPTRHEPTGLAYRVNPFAEPRRVMGVVEIVAVEDE